MLLLSQFIASAVDTSYAHFFTALFATPAYSVRLRDLFGTRYNPTDLST